MEVTSQTCCNQIEVQTWFSSYRLVLTQAISPQQCSLTVNWIVHNFIMWTAKITARDLTTATWVSFSKLCTDSFLNAVSLFTLVTLTSCSGEEIVNKTYREDGNVISIARMIVLSIDKSQYNCIEFVEDCLIFHSLGNFIGVKIIVSRDYAVSFWKNKISSLS